MPEAHTPVEVAEARYRAMVDPARRHLLRVLEDSKEPCDVATLAAQVGLHPNTVRGHLEILERARLVSRSPQKRDTPGRPRMLYSLGADPTAPHPGGYQLLAEMLANTLTSATDNATAIAIESGREWGRYLTEHLPPGERLDPTETVQKIAVLLSDLGFAPEISPQGERTLIELHDCPFRDLARKNDVICSLHLGILQGAARAFGETVTVEELEPFAGPSLCRTVIRPVSPETD